MRFRRFGMMPMRIRRGPDLRPPLTGTQRLLRAAAILIVLLLVLIGTLLATRFSGPSAPHPVHGTVHGTGRGTTGQH